MKNVIYAYNKKSSNKIVYVGQTNNLDYRHKQHIKYDPYNLNNKEYNYPLSRGIRKYGEDEYELIILEDDLLQSQLNEREIYWIKFYDTYFNGYNQSTGGSNPVKPIFDDKLIDLVIEMLKDYENSYQDICDKTGLSMTHIYNINTGNRRKRENIQYPIRPNNVAGTRGLKFNPQQNIEIHNLLLNTHKEFKEIAEMYHCDAATISRINKGATKSYRLKNYTYPLR
jgi:uncharacterized protein YerC